MEAVRVQSVGEKVTMLIRARGHEVTSDEPESVGEDAGPTPYELLLGSLGS